MRKQSNSLHQTDHLEKKENNSGATLRLLFSLRRIQWTGSSGTGGQFHRNRQAIENSPFYNRLVKEGLIEEGRALRMKRLNPEAYDQLEDIENLVSAFDYNHNYAMAKTEITS